MAALQLRPKHRTLHNPSLVNLFSTFLTPPDPSPADQSPSSTSPHPPQSQSQSQSILSSDDWRETLPENSANAESGPKKAPRRLLFKMLREKMGPLRSSSSPGMAQNEGRSVYPMSLSEYQNSFKLKPSTESGPVIGGTGMLLASVFGKERERKGAEGETMPTKTEFVKNYTIKELCKKLRELPPEVRFIPNEMLVDLKEMKEKETESNIGGVHMRDLRESLMTLKMSNDENAMKSSSK